MGEVRMEETPVGRVALVVGGGAGGASGSCVKCLLHYVGKVVKSRIEGV